jgi:hypothetical protein
MHQVLSSMPPLGGVRQPFAAGPFRTPIKDDDLPRLQPVHAAKRVPSATILTREAGVTRTLSRLKSWGITAQPAMPGVAYDLIADVPGRDMIQLQVKTKTQPKGRTCSFTLTWQVFFYAAPIHRISVRAMWLSTLGNDIETSQLVVQSLWRRRQAETLSWLASMTPGTQPVMAPSPTPHDNFGL